MTAAFTAPLRATAGLAITAGATKGSTVLTVADATSITVGKLVRIQQDDLPYVISNIAPAKNNQVMSAMFRVTAKTATRVTVMPPKTLRPEPSRIFKLLIACAKAANPSDFPPVNNEYLNSYIFGLI